VSGPLSGIGTIDGRRVACITPEWLVRFHTGYAIDATDWADVSALCARFGLAVPDDYRRFVETLLSPAATST
jgi:lincosamide nucleotidyltransferase A/C/D/E